MNRFITFLGLWLYVFQLSAQNINGQVVDEQHKPLPCANVLLLNMKDSALIEGTMSNNQGNFELMVPKVPYIVKVSFVGYESCYLNNVQGNIGKVQLKPNSTDLTGFDTQYLMVKLNYNFVRLKLDNTKKSASKDIIDRL